MKALRLVPVILLGILIPLYLVALSFVSQSYKKLPHSDEVNIILPAPIQKITSLDFKGLASDILYLKALVFYGSSYVGKKHRKVEEWEFTWIQHALEASIALDPYFLDPYFLANGVLVWEANRVAETNKLLEKGSRYREWDYWLPFYVGFNYYYFLGDNVKASEYLMLAAKKPGADPFYSYFAARVAYQGNRTQNAIAFLEGVLRTTKDETMRKDYEVRLKVLKIIYDLEKYVALYKERTGKNPQTLTDLIDQHIIGRIPKDPYGGDFFIDKDGSVKTTSNLRNVVR